MGADLCNLHACWREAKARVDAAELGNVALVVGGKGGCEEENEKVQKKEDSVYLFRLRMILWSSKPGAHCAAWYLPAGVTQGGAHVRRSAAVTSKLLRLLQQIVTHQPVI